MSLDSYIGSYGNENKIYTGSSYPVDADLGGVPARVGDVVINNAPSTNVPIGWMCSVAGTVAAPSGTWVAMTFTVTSSVSAALTAHSGGGKGSALALTATTNYVTTAAAGTAPFDSVLLPAATAAGTCTVVNSTVYPIQVFGAGTDTVNGVATATGVTQAPNSRITYLCPVAGAWVGDLGMGYSGSLRTQWAINGITAHSGGTRAASWPLVAMVNNVTTVAALNDSVSLPLAVPGLAITVINSGAKPMRVFAAIGSSDTIDGIAAATGVSQGVNTTIVYYCTVTGAWVTRTNAPLMVTPVVISGDATVDSHTTQSYVLTKGSAAAITLGAPTATTDDGVLITIASGSAFQHVVTATGLFECGTVKTDVATFPAYAGGSITLYAYNAKWIVLTNNLVVFS